MSTQRFTVRIEKEHLVFCCGHFISFRGHQCEKLHGHNYRAAIEIEGPLQEDYYVVDFVALMRLAKEITGALDHHMLLATKNPVIHVHETVEKVRVTYENREWVFPRGDCILLPIENTTAELLARYISGRLAESLQVHEKFVPLVMRVEVEEGPGQSATVEWRP